MSRFGVAFGIARLALGGLSVALALSGSNDDVAFGSAGWRTAFGLVGAAIASAGLVGLVRGLRGDRLNPTPESVRRRRLYGAVVFAIGLWYLAPGFAEGAVRLGLGYDGWAGGVYGLGGIALIFHGLALQIDPTGLVRKLRVNEGKGVRTTATVLRATDLGSLRGQAKVKVDMTIDVNGTPEQHSAKTLLDRARLALIEGATVDVVLDPADPTIFDVDWATLREAPATER
ncbi:MAG TPA: hypothetical protein VEU29_08745 [Actinomycetota bacterium]|nr:hypothetical protein [Actinomycetota bacterium]